MEWYYARDGQQVGPLSDEEFQTAVNSGLVGPATLVWRPGLADWQAWGSLASGDGSGVACAQCGRLFPENEMVHFGETRVCPDCKPIYVQMIREGLVEPGAMVYAGFWVRAGAKIIDYIVLWIVQMVIYLPLGGILGFVNEPGPAMFAVFGLIWLLQMAIAIGYPTFFIGRYGATLGKMACQIKVVTEDGGTVSYARALGRAFAEILSAIILYIGYIMAGFDDEKRALHDRICNTRVIRV